MNILEINLFLIIAYYIFLLLIKKLGITDKIFMILVTVQLIIINGFRHIQVGNDTYRYERSFFIARDINNLFNLFELDYEVGYQLIQKIVTIFTNNFNNWLLIIAVFSFISLALFFKKYSDGIFMSYILFITMGFYDFSFSGIKQSIAITILLWSYKYIIDKKIGKFLICVFIASSIHLSALVFIPAYFIGNLKWKKYHILLVSVMYSVVYLFRYQIGRMLTVIYYEESTQILNKYVSTGSIGGLALFLLATLIIGFIIYNPIKHQDRENIVLFNLIIIAFFIQSLSSFSYLFTRLNMFYLIFITIYIPKIIKNMSKSVIRMNKLQIYVLRGMLFFIILGGVLAYYLNTLQSDGAGIIPYKVWWM